MNDGEHVSYGSIFVVERPQFPNQILNPAAICPGMKIGTQTVINYIAHLQVRTVVEINHEEGWLTFEGVTYFVAPGQKILRPYAFTDFGLAAYEDGTWHALHCCYTPEDQVAAVSFTDLKQWGCPYCGYRSGSSPVSVGGCCLWQCGDCRRTCHVLSEGITESAMTYGDLKPKLQVHPRLGTPSHGNRDEKPQIGGEFFVSRGIGTAQTSGCFVCGGGDLIRSNIAAYVSCKEAGERVVAMFAQGARLDYRDFEPDHIQVKIGACPQHTRNLKALDQLTRAQNGIITPEMVAEASS